ncbi:MAG: PEP-CTERM sorting domain-containing protein [Rubripirellula sp.]
MKKLFLSTLLCSAFLLPSTCKADLLYGLDSTGSNGSFNVFNGFGVDIASPTNVSDWISASDGYNSSLNGGGTVLVAGGNQSSFDITYKVDLTGSHNVTFDKFAVSMQRGGNASSNTVSNAQYSVDGINFSSALVQEVAVGGNGGGNNVGPADTITDFRVPNGFGGSISPQQTNVVSGLASAGPLNSGSFYIRFNIGTSSSGNVSLVTLTDRYDLTTESMALAANNTTSIGDAGNLTGFGNVEDGYDIVWYGSAVAVPEPSSIALVAFGMAGIACRGRRRRA